MSDLAGYRRRVTEAAAFGRVAVLMGGWSAEREVSLISGQAVLDALLARGVDAHGVDADPQAVLSLKAAGFDRAFNVMHGRGGEDGTVQAALQLQGLACTGSGVAACAIAMDKRRSKALWRDAGLPVAADRELPTLADAFAAAAELGFPLIIKPIDEGSSVGISKLHDASAIEAAWRLARGEHGRAVMAETFIAGGRWGHEFTCGIVDGQALPLIRIVPDGEFYDYHAKYVSERTRYELPCGLPADVEAGFQAMCRRAFELVGASGWGRVDFLLDDACRAYLLEINLVPGMTSHSLVPMAARAAGADFGELCWAILETSLQPERDEHGR